MSTRVQEELHGHLPSAGSGATTERADLLAFVHRGTTRARIVTRAHVLLQADARAGARPQICCLRGVSQHGGPGAHRFAEGGVDAVLIGKGRPIGGGRSPARSDPSDRARL